MSDDHTIAPFALNAEVRIPRKYQRALLREIATEAVIDGAGMQQRINVVVLRPRPDLVVRAVGRADQALSHLPRVNRIPC